MTLPAARRARHEDIGACIQHPLVQRPASASPPVQCQAFAYKRGRLPLFRDERDVTNGDRARPHRARGGGVGDPLRRHGHGRRLRLVGAPLTLIDALVELDADELTIVSNNIGEPGRGLGKLLRQGRIKRGISSYFTSNPEAVAAVNGGEIEATLVPQGTFAEAIRAAGAGIAGFLTPVGAGTMLAEGRRSTSSTVSARARAPDPRGRRARLRGARRRARQPLVPAHGAQLQPVDGDGRTGDNRRGGRSCSRRARAGVDPHAAPVRRRAGASR